MTESVKFCGDCEFLSVTEQNQVNKKEPHICTRYNKEVKHSGYHPNLVQLSECDLDDDVAHAQYIIISCPQCGKKINGMIDKSGVGSGCPSCGRRVTVLHGVLWSPFCKTRRML